MAALDSDKLLCMNNMHVIVPLKESYSIYFLLGLINSKLLNWFYQLINPEIGEALAEVKKTNLEKLPINKINIHIEKEKKLYSILINHVKRILLLKKQQSATKTPHERAVLERRIASTDQAIDQLVYELYGLTDEEIGLVEEKAGSEG